MTRPLSTTIPCTLQFSTNATPRDRAPLTRAMVVSEGLVLPSVGKNAAPTKSSISINGQRSSASFGLISAISRMITINTPNQILRSLDSGRMPRN